MSIEIDKSNIGKVYWGNIPVTHIYYGNELIYPTVQTPRTILVTANYIANEGTTSNTRELELNAEGYVEWNDTFNGAEYKFKYQDAKLYVIYQGSFILIDNESPFVSPDNNDTIKLISIDTTHLSVAYSIDITQRKETSGG